MYVHVLVLERDTVWSGNHACPARAAPADGNAEVSTDQMHGRAVGRPAPPLAL